MEINQEDIEITTHYAPISLSMGHAILVRATYKPTGNYVEWNQERSLHKNIEEATRKLKAQVTYMLNNQQENTLFDYKDLIVETYSSRKSAWIAGTDSGVRITHIPTDTVVEVNDFRSQHKNKAKAMELLIEKLKDNKKEKTMGTPHKHAEFIKAWADGAKIEYRYPSWPESKKWEPAPVTPTWDLRAEYRIKPERVYPETTLTTQELENAYLWGASGNTPSLRAVANAAIKRYLQEQGEK